MKLTILKYPVFLAFGMLTVTSIQAQVTQQFINNFNDTVKRMPGAIKDVNQLSPETRIIDVLSDQKIEQLDMTNFTKREKASIKKQDSLLKQQGFIIQKQPPSQGGQSRSLNNIPSTKIKTINTNNGISNPNKRENVIDSTLSGG